MEERMMKKSEVAEMLGVCTKTIQILVGKGELRAYVPGKRNLRFRKEDVEKFIMARELKK